MTELKNSRFTDLLPSGFADAKQVIAMAEAVGKQIEKICSYADGAGTYAAFATMSSALLDNFAVELNTPAYDEDYDLATKRTLVAESMIFQAKMGTPYAVNTIISTIFGNGNIIEWFDYDGDPYHFKARTSNPSITSDDVDEFERVLSSVKRLSAHLDEIILDLSVPTIVAYQGIWVHTGTYHTLQPATM